MSEIKPCPWCGCTELDMDEGSTFRWFLPTCKSCGATPGEQRHTGSVEKDRALGIEVWNRRFDEESVK